MCWVGDYQGGDRPCPEKEWCEATVLVTNSPLVCLACMGLTSFTEVVECIRKDGTLNRRGDTVPAADMVLLEVQDLCTP